MSKPLPPEDLQHVLDHTRGLWEKMRGQRIFVTGGTGFFGGWLLATFAHANDRLDLGAHLVALTRDADAFARRMPHLASDPAIELHGGDVRDFEFPAGKFSHVIHAATTSSAPVEPLEMFETTMAGTRRVLDFAAACGAKKVLITSSGAVYGKQPPGISHVPESYSGAPDCLDPGVAYGEGKRASELLGAIYQGTHGMEVKIARCFAFVGPGLPLDAHFAVGNFIRDALAGGPIRIGGDGTPFRSYLYASDLAIWLWTILFSGRAGRAYNTGSENSASIDELAGIVAACCETPVRIVKKTEPEPGKTASRYVPSTKLASDDLQLKVRVELEEAIRKTIAWHRNTENF